MSDAIYAGLNAEQRAAVAHGTGPLMVLAGAGSGKTRVVTRRIARLLADGVAPGRILALTFTNKAAAEMGRRVADLGAGFVRVATFHSACARFLRADAHLLGFPSEFSIFDVQDRDALIKELMDDLRISASTIKPSLVGQWISRLKNAAVPPKDAYLGEHDLARAVERIWTPYHERLKKLGGMDFDDLLAHFLTILKEFPEVAQGYQQRFPWLLVDEFQDTNRVQFDLLKLLCPPPGNLCVVGDPDQSIYSFRGAEVRNILDFECTYATTKVVRLEQNYRSSATILRAAEQVIANNKQRKDKRLRTDNPAGEKVLRLRANGASEEATTIAGRIGTLRSQGSALNDIAIFYRAHYLSRGLEQALKDAQVPYQIIGGLTFFERREIKDLLAYLRVLVNPLDDVSMSRIINVPPRGIGKVTLERLRSIAEEQAMSLREVIDDSSLQFGLSAKVKNALAGLSSILQAARSKANAHEALAVILRGTDYVAHATSFGDAEDSTREENIAELVSDTVAFTNRGDETGAVGLIAYLQHVSLMTAADRVGDGPAVQMMTVHAAKGLEFPHVFVVGIEDGVFPSNRSTENEQLLEEERRLFYVAMTRAQTTLMLSASSERVINGVPQTMRLSQFWNEVPKDACTTISPYQFDGGLPAADQAARADGSWSVTPDPEQLAQLRPGVAVRHDLYGDGVIRRVTGHGMLRRAVVRFADNAEREFIVEYAGLQVLEDHAW